MNTPPPPRVELPALAFPALTGAVVAALLWMITCGLGSNAPLAAAVALGAAGGAVGAYADRWKNPREVR